MSARTAANFVSRALLDWYRRVLYHHDYFFTSVILMSVHTVLCIMPVVFVPQVVCEDTSNQVRPNAEQFTRWLMLSVFAAAPMFLDITFDFFKSSTAVVERNQWKSRVIMFCALVGPNMVIILSRIRNVSLYRQCLLESAMIPSQTMILLCSVFCAMYQHQIYVANDDDEKKSKFSIEKRSIAAMFHMTTSRALVFLFFLSGQADIYKPWITAVNAFVMVHVVILLARYIWILLSQRQNGEFTTASALSDFLYCTGAMLFLVFGMIVTVILQVVGVIHRRPDLAAVSLNIYRIIFLVIFNLFITVIPGRVHMLSAKLEHQKLQTRLNLIRYVSHEMRSPLNTAFLGLEYVTTELSRMNAECHALRAQQSFSSNMRGSGEDLHSRKAPAKHGSHLSAHGGGGGVALDRGHSDAAIAGFGSSANLHSSTGSGKTGVSDVLDTVKQINASCNIALFTLNDLLTFDKLDEKKLEVELQPVNAWHFALETAKPFKINAKDSGVDFTIACGNFESHWYREYQLRADEFKLSQVLRNLISNALKFTPNKGRVHMQVDMIPNYPTSGILHQGSTLGRLMRIAVTDTGPGISKQNLHKLFGQYVQFNPSKLQKGGGSGLGLWISKSIVEMHGGSVRATSEGEGHGCTFTMELPLFHKSGQSAMDNGTFAVESIPEGADELEAMEGGSAHVNLAQTQSESDHGADAAAAPGKPYVPNVAPLKESFWGGLFRARDTLKGAGQFLNQKVRLTMTYKADRFASDKESSSEAPGRDHYCINSDFDDIERSAHSAEEEGIDENVRAYSSSKLFSDGGTGNSHRVVKIAGRRVSKATVVPVAEDTERSPDDAANDAANALPVLKSRNSPKDSELVDLEAPTPMETPSLNSKTSSFLSPRTKKSWASPLRILAVDDTALNRKMMTRLLVAAGHTVDEACDGLECLAAMNLTAESTTKHDNINTKYDIVLMDENMPNLSGPEAAQKLRQGGYKGLIIGVTGDCYQDQMEHFVHMGANAVLPKPLKLDHLKAKLEELW